MSRPYPFKEGPLDRKYQERISFLHREAGITKISVSQDRKPQKKGPRGNYDRTGIHRALCEESKIENPIKLKTFGCEEKNEDVISDKDIKTESPYTQGPVGPRPMDLRIKKSH
jgi:hypothetical protein